MEKQQRHQTPSFLKLYTGDSDDKLRVPDLFVDQHGQSTLSEKLVLMSSHGSPVVVSVERSSGRGRQRFFFKSGWADFVEENGVEEGDFMVFNFTGDRTVNVIVYDSSGCVKGLKVKRQVDFCTEKKRFRNGDDEETEHASVPRKGKWVQRVNREASKLKKVKPELHSTRYSSGKARGLAKSASFKVDYKKYMKHSMYIRKEFCETTELSVGDKAQLLDPSGEIWSVGVMSGDRLRHHRRLGGSWSDFVRANQLEVGDRLEFCFKAELGLIQVKIDRNKKVMASEVKIERMVGDGVHWERVVVID